MTVLAALLSKVVAWAAERPDVRAILLVGSHARGEARPDSDVDLVILTDRPRAHLEDPACAAFLGPAERAAVEDWGRVTALRVWLRDGLEVELCFTTPDWITERPLDAGTARVLTDGAVVVLDRIGGLAAQLAGMGPARTR